jgi:hypothetical protein
VEAPCLIYVKHQSCTENHLQMYTTAINFSIFFDVCPCLLLNLNSVNQLIVVMVKCGVLFEVRTGYLNNI